MDNVTHSLVGLVASKAGLERLSPRATVVCILAANAPDADIAALLFGDRWTYLHHHRGITHSIVGSLVLALFIPLAFYLVDHLLAAIRKRQPSIRLQGLLAASLVVSSTHSVMDWTNNYGIRFLLPWSSRWFYGDLVFIVDPFIWLLLGSACFLLTSKTRAQKLGWIFLCTVLTILILFSTRGGNLPSPWLIRGVWFLLLVGLVVLFKKRLGE